MAVRGRERKERLGRNGAMGKGIGRGMRSESEGLRELEGERNEERRIGSGRSRGRG